MGDDEKTVRRNREIVAQSLGFEASQIVSMQQTHSANVTIVTKNEIGHGALNWNSAIPNTDAVITDETNLPLLILVADCAPLLFVDVEHRVFATVHAGWRGAVARIASKTLQTMTQVFGTDPQKVRVGIGPTLCARCFEIGEEVADAAQEIAPDAVLRDDMLRDDEKPHLDLRALLRADLTRHRVLDVHIEIIDRKSTRLNSSHSTLSRMPSSA